MKKKSKSKKLRRTKNKITEYLPKEPTALLFDRDKNSFYRANDEAIDEIFNEEGYQSVVHANWDPRWL